MSNQLTTLNFTAAKHHAQEFHRLGTEAGQHAILCGFELIRLHELHGISQGKASNLSHDGISWETIVERETGLAKSTAHRWTQAARAQQPQLEAAIGPIIDISEGKSENTALVKAVKKITAGKTLDQLLLPLDAEGHFNPAGLTPQKQERLKELKDAAAKGDAKAAELVTKIEAGELDPGRAYAGWAGENGRQASGKTGGKQATNHMTNIAAGLVKLKHSLKKSNWRANNKEGWDNLKRDFRSVMKQLPEELRDLALEELSK